ncbi:MAG: sigma-70 family RNA polymerase sigma factor [Planctomycetota bacterium]|nr:sigma-70 family RNA polymerase sigma factor [Planctomycetota bacterium]
MSASESFVELVSRLEQSDAAATAEVWRRYVHRLAGIALQHLPPSIRAKTDVDDILQSTFLSFVQGFRAGRFAVPDWASLEGLLILITLRKCRRRLAHYRTASRDVRREQTLTPDSAERVDIDLASAAAGPEEETLLKEVWTELLGQLSPQETGVFRVYLEGLTVPEIAARQRCSERTVRRTLQTVRKRLETMAEE